MDIEDEQDIRTAPFFSKNQNKEVEVEMEITVMRAPPPSFLFYVLKAEEEKRLKEEAKDGAATVPSRKS